MEDQLQLERKFINLGDPRRNDRFINILNTFIARPNLSIPQIYPNWYDVKATYSFWKSPNVKYSDMLHALSQATVERTQNQETVLCIQDTTNVCFGVDADGLGYLDHGKGKGFLCHNNLCLNTQGVPLGIIDQYIWARKEENMGISDFRGKRSIEEKESYRWIAGKAKAESLLCEKVGRIVTIADRESDIFELFTTPRPENSHLLIRASHDRETERGARLWKILSTQPVAATKTIKIQRNVGKKLRDATVEIRYGTFIFPPPKNKIKEGSIELQTIMVKEIELVKGESPVEWVLLTTLPISDKEDVLKYVIWYTFRWTIERFHFVLKEGCRVEDLQLKNSIQLKNAVLTFSHVAFKLLWLTYESRTNGEKSCEEILEKAEWKTLCISKGKKVDDLKPPTINQAIRMIAMLGGFLGRKSDGNPGVKTLWRGMICLQERTIMYKELKNVGRSINSSFG